MSATILICEPQCRAFEHAAVNAALLHTTSLAFPDKRLVFLAETGHLRWVRDALDHQVPQTAERIDWKELGAATRPGTPWRRLAREMAWCGQLMAAATTHGADAILLSSITSSGLLALKLRLYRAGARVPIVAIPHAVLGTLLEPQPRRPERWLLALRQVLRLPHPHNLSYIALGESIADTLRAAYPRLSHQFRTLELPVFWASETPGNPAPAAGRVRFGFLGSGEHPAKGFDTFLRLASEVSSHSTGAEFVVVGNVPRHLAAAERSGIVSGISIQPLTVDEYNRRAAGLHFALTTGSPHHYRLRASATFLDALSHVRPGVYLRTPYVDHYFKLLGDIGYICDSYEEMRDLILRLASEFPAERYRQQCANILAGRRLFEPAVLAPELRRILNGGAA